MRARRRFAAVLTASVLLLTAACGSKDDNAEESTGSPEVTSAASAQASEEPSEEPSESASPEASSSSGSSSESGKVVESMDGKTVTLALELVDGKPKVRPPVKVDVKKGQTFELFVTSDKAYEIHVHTYDETVDLKPGKEGKISFVADKTGSFEVEVEDTKFKLFDLQVK